MDPDQRTPDTPGPDAPAPDTRRPDTRRPDTPARDAPAPDAPLPDTPGSDAPAPDAPAAAAPGDAPGGVPGGVPGGASADRRGGRSARDMALSLAVLLVPLLLLLTFYRVALDGDRPAGVDPGPALAQARAAAAFPVAVPGPDRGWTVQSAAWRAQPGGGTLRLGYVDPDGDPVQVVQSSTAAAALLPAELGPAARPAGRWRSPAGVWQRYDARRGEQALVLAEPGRTVVVIGRAAPARLESLAASLR